MALELFIGKYIDDLVPTNPVGGTDPKSQGDDHIQGIKLVLQNTFPQLSGIMNCTETELNYLDGVTPGNNLANKAVVLDVDKNLQLGIGDIQCANVIPSGSLYQGGIKITSTAAELNKLDGDVGVLNQADDIVLFYMASAPTGWTQETALSNLDGSTIRVETGAGGGAVAGTHNIESPPSISHSHADTLYTQSVVLTSSQIPSHYHFLANSINNADSSAALLSTDSMCWGNSSGNNDNYELEGLPVGTYPASRGRSGLTGSGGSHSHTVYGSVSSATLTAFAPKYVNMILCKKD